MTREEAIQLIQDIQNVRPAKKQALDIAKRDIGMQISKKVIPSNNTRHRYHDYFCPNCGAAVGYIHGVCYHREEHHCICGQSLDWNGTEFTEEQEDNE